MEEKQTKLVLGALLYDLGKVLDKGDGYKVPELNEAENEIIAFAKNAAMATEHYDVGGFDKSKRLFSVFNILNGNQGKMIYAPRVLNRQSGIGYPQEDLITADEAVYRKIQRNIEICISGLPYTKEGIQTLLNTLEANLSYVPATSLKGMGSDISLYDSIKMTAAFSACIGQYMEANNIVEAVGYLRNQEVSQQEKMFLLYSMDISGIQKFIYTISSKKALKGLRARSFYLEMVMEHIIDDLLEELSLTRANVVYAGGGHCYILLPNTEAVTGQLEKYEKAVNKWFLDNFGIVLYVAGGYAPCSVKDLRNEPKGSYRALYNILGEMISHKKFKRYDSATLLQLNKAKTKGERECAVCLKSADVDAQGRCPVCVALEEMATDILYKDYFVVVKEPVGTMLPLPGAKYLTAISEAEIINMAKQTDYVRCYVKNTLEACPIPAIKLWIGDYTTGDSFEELADKAEGIKRIAVLRADVDNLGNTFVRGFEGTDGDDAKVTLSRTATLSRQLSLFFKFYINTLLKQGEENRLHGSTKRNIAVVYSGGDDVFLVGAWDDVVEAAVDLSEALKRFSEGTLTISAGIGIYHEGFPVNVMAKEVGRLEDASKAMPQKNAVTLFSEENSFSWDVFEEHILGEKLKTLNDFFAAVEDRGNAFLYHLLELLRNQEERINRARYVYLLSRMEPEKNRGKEEKQAYAEFSQKMYKWFGNKQDRAELMMAILLYVYVNRKEEEK